MHCALKKKRIKKKSWRLVEGIKISPTIYRRLVRQIRANK